MNKALLPLVLLCALCAPADAQVYRTVDERGNVSYSDMPASGSKSQRVAVTAASPADNAAAKEKRDQFLGEQRQKNEVEAVERERRKSECNLLLAQRTQLNLPGPYSVPMPNGGVLVATGRAKLDLLRGIESQVQKKCQQN